MKLHIEVSESSGVYPLLFRLTAVSTNPPFKLVFDDLSGDEVDWVANTLRESPPTLETLTEQEAEAFVDDDENEEDE